MSSGKTWVYWSDRIEQEIKRLCSSIESNGHLQPWHLHDEEQQVLLSAQKENADAACLRFCQTGEWPEMSLETQHSIYFRLDVALRFVLRLVVIFGGKERVVLRPPNLKITPEPEVWHFLLFDLWDNGNALFVPNHPNTQKVQKALGQIMVAAELLQEAVK